MTEKVILVDENDREIGTEEKLKAHELALLHRAFSLFVFNSRGQLLLQKRASGKYHSSGLWTNTCCSHPQPGELTETAVHRKVRSEMGFDCVVREIFQFIYKVKFENHLFEHEVDHVFIGKYDSDPVANPEEVEAWKWVNLGELKEDVRRHPEFYADWLSMCLDHPALKP